MAAIQNIVIDDQGVSVSIDFDYRLDGTQEFIAFSALIPRDLDDIPADDLDGVMLDLGLAIARGRGIEI